jgi:dihydrofolate synthase/folylpolyglutamate synthase
MNIPQHTFDNSGASEIFKSYPEVISYLYSRLPMFSRIGADAIKADLINTEKFCSHLSEPQNRFKSVHIGGTNGKGSSSHMLAAILQTAGYKTGLCTSPHLKDFRERIRINGEMISEQEVLGFVNENYEFIEGLEPSFFEATVAMAFDHFASNKVDIAIIEVGLGGRLDSTNVINPELSLISNIGYDHMNILGNTLQLIAGEKAGIIKKGVPVVISQKQDEVAGIFLNKAKEQQSEIVFASEEWLITRGTEQDNLPEYLKVNFSQKNNKIPPEFNFSTLDLDLTGSYQLKNLGGVLSTVKQLRRLNYVISDYHIINALRQVKLLTGLMGRWQIIQNTPRVMCDTGHNEDGIKEVLKNIEQSSFNKLHMVIGILKDKDSSGILKMLPEDAVYYFCQPNLPRAKPAIELRDEARAYKLRGDCFFSVSEALDAAKNSADKDDLIFVGGSTFVVAEIV